jgi:glycosyltransferase involved in cell wall biosynthesis
MDGWGRVIESKDNEIVGDERKRVLVCVGRYLPGYRSGGPVRSIANLVAYLSGRFDFYIVTRDRDVTDTKPYHDIAHDQWCEVGNAHILYCSSIGPSILLRAFRLTRPDFIYLNSFHDTFTRIMVVLHRVGALGKTPMLIAPRGEFSPGAMKFKWPKKVLYRQIAKILGLHDKLLWHAVTSREKADILKARPGRLLDSDCVCVASNISEAIVLQAPHVEKVAGSVKLVYLGRMSPIKNLLFLLEIMRELQGDVLLNLYGAVEEKDVAYWEKCRAAQANLPDNIKVEYRGTVEHAAVSQVLHDHHFFVLPTLGENYCHAAVESFINGTPVVLSDESPWLHLSEMHAGFDISLNSREKWIAALQMCIDMDQHTYTIHLNGAREYSRRFAVEELARQNVVMFEAAMRT